MLSKNHLLSTLHQLLLEAVEAEIVALEEVMALKEVV